MERRIAGLRHLQVDDFKFWMLGKPLRNNLPKTLSIRKHRRGEDLDTIERISWTR